MRGTRWLLLLAILAILGGTGALYRLQRRIVQSRTPPKPAALPLDTNNLAFDYEYAQSTAGQTKFKVRAKKFRQVGQTAVFDPAVHHDIANQGGGEDQQHLESEVTAFHVPPRFATSGDVSSRGVLRDSTDQ